MSSNENVPCHVETILCYKGECRKPSDKITLTWLKYVELLNAAEKYEESRAGANNTKSGVYTTRTDREIE